MGLLFLNSIYNIIALIDNLIRDLIGLAFEKITGGCHLRQQKQIPDILVWSTDSGKSAGV